MKRNDSNGNDVILIAALLTGALFLMMACNQITRLLSGEPPTVEAGYQQITSAHESYYYLIPEDWTKTGFNSYEGDKSEVIEQIYPPATITEDYCRSFVYLEGSDYTVTVVENRIYNNGQMEGCYIINDILNTQLNKERRHTIFSFVTDRGVESLTIISEKENYSEEQVSTIIDSIRIK